jgi:hypothetical protein
MKTEQIICFPDICSLIICMPEGNMHVDETLVVEVDYEQFTSLLEDRERK